MAKNIGRGCAVAYKSMQIVLIKVSNVFARYFQDEADNRLYSFNFKHDLTIGIKYKINLIMYFACAYPQHEGGEGVMQLNTDYFFKILIETVQLT